MATRSDLPKNKEADEMRNVAREAAIEYLRKMATSGEREAILKAAFKEWMDARFGLVYLSLQAVVAVIFCYLVYLYISTTPNK
mgnify:CR=1 FL=1